MSQPLVSIVVPVYNVEHYLSKCIDSIREQTIANIEIIAVNDGSTDTSLEILQRYADLDSRICIINQDNQGLSGARNTGIQAARGDYIMFVDSDDFIESDTVAQCLKRIREDRSDIVVFGYRKLTETLQVIAQPFLDDALLDREEALQALLSLAISPMACNKFIKTEILRENHITFPLAKLHEDVGTMYKIFWSAKRVSTLSKSFYNWLTREDSITGTITFKHIHHMSELLLEKKTFLEEQGVFNTYQDAYNIGIVKLLTLMLERAMNSSIALVEYLLYIIDNELLISQYDIDAIQEQEQHVYNRYEKRLSEGRRYASGEINRQTFYTLQKENRALKGKLEHIQGTVFYPMYLAYMKGRDILFPKGSKRRELLKKIKG